MQISEVHDPLRQALNRYVKSNQNDIKAFTDHQDVEPLHARKD